MTLEQMINALVDKGYSQKWAESEAVHDYFEMNEREEVRPPSMVEECSVCRRTMRRIEYKYHYHPCE